VKSDIPEIRAALNAQAENLCRRLLPHGKAMGGLWVSHNPRVAGDDRKVPALKVRIAGGDVGAWTDHRNGRDGAAGDLIGLIGHCQGTDTKGALAWARDFLGLKAMTRQEREAMRFAAEAARQRQAGDAEKRRRGHFEWARKMFFEQAFEAAGQPIAASHARGYFSARKMPLERIVGLNPETFRFSAATEWWKGATWRTEGARRMKVADGPEFPAVHSAMRLWNGMVACCHVTFLDPVKPAKAPVEPPKLMAGLAQGAVIEIAMGPEKMPFWRATAPHPVILAEGIETAGAIAIAVPEARVWACGSIAGFAHAPAGLPCVGSIFLARDNNEGNQQAERQVQAALDALEAHGRPVTVMRSHVGDDFNDLA
jgi:hypothetical protein